MSSQSTKHIVKIYSKEVLSMSTNLTERLGFHFRPLCFLVILGKGALYIRFQINDSLYVIEK